MFLKNGSFKYERSISIDSEVKKWVKEYEEEGRNGRIVLQYYNTVV